MQLKYSKISPRKKGLKIGNGFKSTLLSTPHKSSVKLCWNEPNIGHRKQKDRRCCFLTRKDLTWMVQMHSNLTGTMKISHSRYFLHKIVDVVLSWSKEQWGFRLYRGVKPRLVTLTCWREHPYWMKTLAFYGNGCIFQKDNAAVHNAHRTNNSFKTNNVILLNHPTCSSDLNPIVNVWDESQRSLQKRTLVSVSAWSSWSQRHHLE